MPSQIVPKFSGLIPLYEIYSQMTNFCASTNFFTMLSDVTQQFLLFSLNIFTAVCYVMIQESLNTFMPWAFYLVIVRMLRKKIKQNSCS